MDEIFDSNTSANPPSDVTVDVLVGEGRKYSDPDQLAKAYVHADTRLAELTRDLAKERMERQIEKDLYEQRQDPENKEKRQDPPADPNPAKTVDVSSADFQSLIREQVKALSEEEKYKSNLTGVLDLMKNHYGSNEKAAEAVRNRAEELGVSVDWLKQSAAISPAAFKATMGIQDKKSVSTPSPNSEVNLHRDAAGKVRNANYYNELRRSDKTAFFSREVQREMFEQAKAMGDSFYA